MEAKTAQETRPDVSNERPTKSPYGGDISLRLGFKEGCLHVTDTALFKYPKLESRYRKSAWFVGSIGAGHVLIHFLYTGTYQGLEPTGSSPEEKVATEFATSFQVYTLARECEMPILEDLAKVEMERFGGQLSLRHVLNAVGYARRVEADDKWFHDFLLKSVVEPVVNGQATPTLQPDNSSAPYSITTALFQLMIDMCREKAAQAEPTTMETYPDPQPTTVATIPEMVPDPQPATEAACEPQPDSVDRLSTVATYSDSQDGAVVAVKPKKKAKWTKERKAARKQAREEARMKAQEEESTRLAEEEAAVREAQEQEIEEQAIREGEESRRDLIESPDFETVSIPEDTSPSSDGIDLTPSSSSSSGRSGSSGYQGFPPESTLAAGWREMKDVPLSAGAEWYRVVYESERIIPDCNYFHICAQEKFLNFSPEELRWKHQLLEMSSSRFGLDA